jgi:undecaprenyl-diphosphatase
LSLDLAIFRWINEHRNPLLDGVLGVVSALGEMSAVWLLSCVVMFLFGRKEQKRAAVVFLVSLLILDGLAVAAIKGLWQRPRPYLALAGVHKFGVAWKSSSFPSGHAYSSAMAAVIFGAKFRQWLLPLALFAGLTCYSRPYLGMHYPSDVLAGAVIGVLVGLLALRIEKSLERERESAKPAWWSLSSFWSLFFSLVGAAMVVVGAGGASVHPLDVLTLGLILGLPSWRSDDLRKRMGIAGSVIGFAGLLAVLRRAL